MSFIDVIMIRIHPFENFMTFFALILLGVSVPALYVPVHVGAPALIITDQAPPDFAADFFHSFPGLVFRIDKFV